MKGEGGVHNARPWLKPRPLNPESSTLAVKPLRLPRLTYKEVQFYLIKIGGGEISLYIAKNCLLIHKELITRCFYFVQGHLITNNTKMNVQEAVKSLTTYLVCPILCTRPTACSSWAGFIAGSTNNTCVASMILRPLDPVCKGRRRTPTEESCLNVCRFD